MTDPLTFSLSDIVPGLGRATPDEHYHVVLAR